VLLSRNITTGNGYALSYYGIGKYGGLTFKTPQSSLVYNYTMANKKISCTGTLNLNGVLKNTTFHASLNTDKKTPLGLDTGTISSLVTFEGNRYLLTVDISGTGTNTKLSLNAEHAGRDYFNAGISFSTSNTVLTVPTGD
jgi:hypothetical protein